MKMRTLRRLRAQAPRQVRRVIRGGGRDFDFTDATIEPHPEPPPEAVFDRLTGPFGRRHGGLCDEET
jgi:hypothetical protein